MSVYFNNPVRKAVGVLRFFWARLAHGSRLKASGLGLLGRGSNFFITGKGRAELAGKIALNDFATLYSSGTLKVGHNFYVNKFASIIAMDEITIGDNVSVGQFTTILDHDHAYHGQEDGNIRFEGYHTAPIRIGNNVWIANHCTVLRGVQIGNNVVVGANTLVHKDVPDNCVVMGVPYKIIKKI